MLGRGAITSHLLQMYTVLLHAVNIAFVVDSTTYETNSIPRTPQQDWNLIMVSVHVLIPSDRNCANM